MWISKADFDELRSRIERLETDLSFRVEKVEGCSQVDAVGNFPRRDWGSYLFGIEPARKMPVNEAVKIIADHLGIRLRWHDADSKPAHGTVEKKPADTIRIQMSAKRTKNRK
jgi:hypothetical protein